LGDVWRFERRTKAEARTFFTKFVAAQNAHDASAVKAMLWDFAE